MKDKEITDADYTRLLDFRDGLRRFLNWSEQQAKVAGLTAAQHQLLLAIRGHHPGPPTIADVAAHLLLRHHSAVELVDRAQAAGLVERETDSTDHRLVRLRVTHLGAERLASLSAQHLDELRSLEPRLRPIWADLA